MSDQTTEAKTQAAQAQSAAQQAAATAQQAAPTAPVTSGQERVKLAISGQVNRAVNMVDDGDNLKAYYVDNDASNSRARSGRHGQVDR